MDNSCSVSSSALIRRNARREAAARAVLPRLAREGYAEASLSALAKDAGHTKQGLLFYFQDKGDLFVEAACCACEDVHRALVRQVTGESGVAGLRALRRGLDSLQAVTPDALWVHLDFSGCATHASSEQAERMERASEALLGAMESALSKELLREEARSVGQLAYLALFACHREARSAVRSGRRGKPRVAADLDAVEGLLVRLVHRLRA